MESIPGSADERRPHVLWYMLSGIVEMGCNGRREGVGTDVNGGGMGRLRDTSGTFRNCSVKHRLYFLYGDEKTSTKRHDKCAIW